MLAVLNDAARRLQERSISQWPDTFEADWVMPDIVSGATWVARRGGVPIATITVGWTDPLWPDDGLAGYVHRLARSDDAPGVGDLVLRWADQRIRARQRRFMRLDCVASNAGLRAFYATRGFVYRGATEVSGPPGSRNGEGAKTVLSLHEREVQPVAG